MPLSINPYQFDTRTHNNGGAGVTGFSCVGRLFVQGLGWAKLVLLALHQLTPCIRLLTDGIKHLQSLQRKKIHHVCYLNWIVSNLGHLVVSVHDRLSTRKNRKLTYRKRKFKVSPRGSPVNSLHCTSLLKKTYPHLDAATCVWADCVGHSSVFPVLQ